MYELGRMRGFQQATKMKTYLRVESGLEYLKLCVLCRVNLPLRDEAVDVEAVLPYSGSLPTAVGYCSHEKVMMN